jgi:hypothetical protein
MQAGLVDGPVLHPQRYFIIDQLTFLFTRQQHPCVPHQLFCFIACKDKEKNERVRKKVCPFACPFCPFQMDK